MGLIESLNNFLNNIFQPGPQFTIFKPLFEVSSPVPPPIDNRSQIAFIQNEISQAQRFFKNTFPKVINPADRCNHPSCKRGPNLLGSLARKGNVLAINPFTGGQFVIGVTQRSSVTNFAAINFNRATLARGLNLQGQIQAFISGSRTQIGLLRSKQTI